MPHSSSWADPEADMHVQRMSHGVHEARLGAARAAKGCADAAACVWRLFAGRRSIWGMSCTSPKPETLDDDLSAIMQNSHLKYLQECLILEV